MSLSLSALNGVLEELKKEYVEMKDGEALFTSLSSRLQSVYDNPPLEECKACVNEHTAAVSFDPTNEELRMIMFDPSLDEIKLYPLFLAHTNKQGVLNSRPRSLFLSLMFLWHRRKWWFLAEFIAQGGLSPLADLLVDENLYFRGQAVDILLSAVDCDVYDWFATPLQQNADVTLHLALIEALFPSSGGESLLLKNLCLNNCSGDVAAAEKFPGGSVKCLQILGFVLSWVRRLYTRQQLLVLSTPIVQQLNLWRRSRYVEQSDGGIGETASGVEELHENEELHEAERKFAQELYLDFVHQQFGREGERDEVQVDRIDGGRYCVFDVDRSMCVRVDPQAKSTSESDPDSASAREEEFLGTGKESKAYAPGGEMKDAHAGLGAAAQLPLPTPQSETTAETVDEFKDLGNKHFQAGRYDCALANYTAGLNMLLSQCGEGCGGEENFLVASISGAENISMLVNLLHNLSTIMWKSYQAEVDRGDSGGPNSQSRDQLSKCLMFRVPLVVEACKADSIRVKRSSEVPPSDPLEGKPVLRLLHSCEQLCRIILNITCGRHLKATYRLAMVLLRLGRPVEGVELVDAFTDDIMESDGEKHLSLGGSSENDAADAVYTLKAVRRQCVSSILVANSTVESSETRPTSSASSGLISDKVSCVLQALQSRRDKTKGITVNSKDENSSRAEASGGQYSDPTDNIKTSTRPIAGLRNDGDSEGLHRVKIDDIDETPGAASLDKVLQLSQAKPVEKSSKSSSGKGKASSKSSKGKSNKRVIIPGLESLGDLSLSSSKVRKGSTTIDTAGADMLI